MIEKLNEKIILIGTTVGNRPSSMNASYAVRHTCHKRKHPNTRTRTIASIFITRSRMAAGNQRLRTMRLAK